MKTTEKTQIELKEIQDKLEQTIKRLGKLQKSIFSNHIIDNSDFIRLMNISNSTAKNWRKKGIIPYSQIQNKIYYKTIDIQKMINDNYNL